MNSYSPFLDWINSQEQTLQLRLKEWVSINTFSLHNPGLEELLDLLDSSFKILGGKHSYFKLYPHKILGPDGSFQLHLLAPALLIKKHPEAEIQILLGGHIDTVYPPSSSFQKIEEFVPGIWKGPGVSDMKGGIAVLLTALEALERSSFAGRIGWEVLLTPDEEIGSPGSTSLYQDAAQRHQCGLLFEPSFPDGAFVSSRKGSATYTIAVHGQAAHVGRDYSKGKSAVFALMHLIQKLENVKSNEDVTINVADLEGKGPVNIVPPFAKCRVNFRTSNQKVLEEMSNRLQEIIKESEQEGIQIEAIQETFRPPKPFLKRTQQLFNAYASCAYDLSLPFQIRETGGVCDGNILASAGLPTLDTAGVIGGGLHTHDEYLICSSLVERARLAALFLFKLANREIVIEEEKIDGK